MVRARDLTERQISHAYLRRLYQRGQLRRIGRGLYSPADVQPSANYTLAEACKRVTGSVICLLSALQFHQLGPQVPFEVWVAIHPKAHSPRVEYPPLRVVRFSGAALTEGVEEHRVPEGAIRVYGVPKTVVDCFRYRNKIGLDVALEALQEARRENRATIPELWHYAKLLRVARVMQRYLESLS